MDSRMVSFALAVCVVTLLCCGVQVEGTSSCITLDDPSMVRDGSDFLSFETPSDDIAACEEACCSNLECDAISYNSPQPFDYLNCTKGSHCCLLKNTVPKLSPNHYGAAVRTGSRTPTLPRPTKRQQEFMDMGFTQFMHFSVTTFGDNVEHNCLDGTCLSAQLFNPTNLSTDQWVESAVAMGVGEICLTAHHEGGFCLWPSKYSPYGVESSPYNHDIVKMFVASCHKYGIRPCFYIGPNANGYLTQVQKDTPKEFLTKQLGMLTEVLTNYGFIDRLWWDHYEMPCGHLSMCPGGFPAGWRNATDLVRRISPNTLLGTGPDVGHSYGGETGVGSYPIWNSCSPIDGDPLQKCANWNPRGNLFRPREADATIQNPGDRWFWHPDRPFWNASQIWDHYALTVGRGDNFILNMPPDRTGQIPAEYVAAGTAFGDALRATFSKPVAIQTSSITTDCSQPVVLNIGSSAQSFDTIVTREDMATGGQRIAGYAYDTWDDATSQWKELADPGIHGQTVGNRIIDFLQNGPVTTTKIRFRCTSAIMSPVTVRSIGLYVAKPPQ